jgi:DNA-binding transcriptional LysR family regulator
MTASEALIEAADRMDMAIAREDAVDGRVRVAIRSAFSGVGIGDEIASMLIGAPKLRLQIVVVDDDADLLGLHAQGVDLAVQVGALKDSAFVAKRLGEVPFTMCASPRYLRSYGRPKKPADLIRHECIRRLGAAPEARWPLIARSGRKQLTPIGGRVECSDARFQSEILYAGFGIGLRPAAEVRRGVQEGTLERVLPSFSLEPVPVWLVAPKGRLRLPRVQRVAELLGRVIGSLS